MIQASVAVGGVQVAVWLQSALPKPVFTVIFVGQPAITGGVTSTKFIVKVQVDELPFLSVTVKVTGIEVTDAPKIEPTGMLCVTLLALKPQASALLTLKVKSGIV